MLTNCFEVSCSPSKAVLQIWVNGPAQNNFIAIPDASGVFVVDAVTPLFIDNTGTVALDQNQIVQVGQLVAGSIGRTFGETPCADTCLHPKGLVAPYYWDM